MTVTNLRVKVLRQPIIRAKFIPWLSATIVGRTGISVERDGLNYLLDLDYSKFFELNAFTPADKLIAVQGRDGIWNTTSIETLRHQIGADNPNLVAISGAATATDKLGWWSDTAQYSLTDFTSYMRSLLDDPDASTARATLGLVIGTDVQPHDAELDALAGLVSAADKLPYFTGPGAAALTGLTSYARSLLDDADAATARATLGLVIGTDVQAHDSDLDAIAALAPADNDIIQRKGGAWVNRSVAQFKTDLSLATVATTGAYVDLTGKPTLGSAAATDATDYATAAQGSKADSAVQPGSLATVATSGAYADLSGKPYTVPTGGLTGQILAKKTDADGDAEWINGSGGTGEDPEAVVACDSIASLRTRTDDRYVYVESYYGDNEGGGGVFRPDPSDTTSVDNGGSIIVRNDSMRMKRVSVNENHVNVLEWGASPSLINNTSVYDKIIAATPNGAVIEWPKLDGVWKGHFIPPSGRSFILRGNGNTLQEVINAQLIFMQGTISAPITTLTASVGYGAKVLPVSSSSGLSAGDLIVLEDGKEHPSDVGRLINQEILRVKSIDDGTHITVEDMVRSDQDTGTKNVMKITPVVGAEIHDFKAAISDPYLYPADTGLFSVQPFRIDYSDRSKIVGCSSLYSYGEGINMRYAYEFELINNKVLDGSSPDYGGYGVSVYVGRFGINRGTFTRRTRNGADFHACYNVSISDHDIATCVYGIAVCHNIYGGGVTVGPGRIRDVKTNGVMSAVQSMTGAQNFILRDVTIRGQKIAMYEAADSGVQSYGIYIQSSYSNLTVDDIECSFGRSATNPKHASAIVRLDGVCRSRSVIRGVRTPNGFATPDDFYGAGWVVFNDLVGSVTGSIALLVVEDCYNYWGQGVVYGQGLKHLSSGNLTMGITPVTAIKSLGTKHSISNVTDATYGVLSLIQ